MKLLGDTVGTFWEQTDFLAVEVVFKIRAQVDRCASCFIASSFSGSLQSALCTYLDRVPGACCVLPHSQMGQLLSLAVPLHKASVLQGGKEE